MNSNSACCPQPETPTPSSNEAAANVQLARLAKALGHPARVAILRLLLKRDSCVCGEIVDELPLAQSTVSQHLKQLKDAGLICGEVDGPRVCYCVDQGGIALLQVLVEGLKAERLSSDHRRASPTNPLR
jgi:DNA-binding transcriptional ArsR family regulator